MANVIQARRSTVAYKYAMAISGLIMVAFLLLHMYGNLMAFGGRETFDTYAEHLRTIGRPLLPYRGLLWIIRVVLLVSVLVHIYCALTLWKRNRTSGGYIGATRYRTKQNRTGVQRSYASFTMRWGGIVIALFIIYHLLHLSADNVIHPGGASSDPYLRLVNGFQIWWVVLSYVIAMLAVGFHLWHGFWSAFTSLGQNHSNLRRVSKLNYLAIAISVIITVGFLLPPFSILFGWVS